MYKKFTANQIALLQTQYSKTPARNETFGSTGEHWILFHMLQTMGVNPTDEWNAIELTERILTYGYLA